MSEWNATQYLKFNTERTQPAIDLVNRLCELNPESIIDIGCGPGNSTIVLKNHFPNAYILGVDNSQNMINIAKSIYEDIDFMVCDVPNDLQTIEKEFDIVFSNACIQWIPDHTNLLKQLMNLLSKNGVLAIQIPYNYDEPIHKIIKKVSESNKWKSCFTKPRQKYVLKIEEYYDLLSDISNDFNIWATTYFHTLKSYDDIIEWYRGTGLRPYLDVLDDITKLEFEEDILYEIKKAYPKQKNNDIIFKFPRLFFIAQK